MPCSLRTKRLEVIGVYEGLTTKLPFHATAKNRIWGCSCLATLLKWRFFDNFYCQPYSIHNKTDVHKAYDVSHTGSLFRFYCTAYFHQVLEINRSVSVLFPTVRKDEPPDAMVRDLGFNMLWHVFGVEIWTTWTRAKVPQNTLTLPVDIEDCVFWISKRCTVCLYWSLFWIRHSNLFVSDYAIDWRGIATTLGGIFACLKMTGLKFTILSGDTGWVNPLMVLLDHVLLMEEILHQLIGSLYHYL